MSQAAPAAGAGSDVLWLAAIVVAGILAAVVLFFWHKGRRMPGQHVFRASG